jgi:hypothetical protein
MCHLAAYSNLQLDRARVRGILMPRVPLERPLPALHTLMLLLQLAQFQVKTPKVLCYLCQIYTWLDELLMSSLSLGHHIYSLLLSHL